MIARVSSIVAGVLALCGLAVCCTPALAADPVPEYFSLPAGNLIAGGIAAAPDGTVWFGVAPQTSPPSPSLGRLTVAQASPGTANGIATFPTPVLSASCCANAVRSVAFDGANNRVWFVQSDAIVGFADAGAVSPGTSNGITATLRTTSLMGGGTFYPAFSDVAVGAGGLAWYTINSASNVVPYPGDRIASINSALSVTESENIAFRASDVVLNPLRYDAKPAGIAVAPDGTPWFAESDPGNPGYRIARANGTGYDEYLIQPCGGGSPCSGSFTGTGPTDVAVAKDGSIWFTNQLKNEVGRLDPGAGTFTNYSLPGIDAGLAGGQARAISAAADGSLWVAESGGYGLANANAIVKLVPSSDPGQPNPTATVWHLGAGKFPLAVAPDTKGNVWFSLATDVAPSLIGRLAGVVSTTGGGGGGGGTVVKPSSTGVAKIGVPTTNGTSLTVNQICVGPPADRCSLIFLIATHEYVTGFPGSKASAASWLAMASAAKAKKKAKPKPVILGSKTVTLKGGQHKKVTVTLNKAGRKLLNSSPTGKLTVYFTATQKGAKGKPAKRVKKAKVTFKVKPPKRHRLSGRRLG